MEKEFIGKRYATLFRDLGFDESCFAYYRDGDFRTTNELPQNSDYSEKPWFLCVPLWQQAFDWLRRKHGLICWIRTTTIEGVKSYHCEVVNENISAIGQPYCQKFQALDIDSYVEARRIVLENAILIVK